MSNHANEDIQNWVHCIWNADDFQKVPRNIKLEEFEEKVFKQHECKIPEALKEFHFNHGFHQILLSEFEVLFSEATGDGCC